MIALILNIILTVLFFHTIRSAQVRGQNMMVVAAVNYALASSGCFGLSALQDNLVLSGPTLFWGTVQGIAFIGTYYLICVSMHIRGMAIATAILRLSVVIPILASIFYWGEVPSAYQTVGILTCLVALPLICVRQKQAGSGEKLGRRGGWVVGALFVGMGIASVASKAFVEAKVPDAQTTFMGVLYGVAGLGSIACFALPAWRKSRLGVWDGVKMGVVNVGSILSFLVALGQVTGVVAFPVQAVGGMLLNTLFAAVVWQERFVRMTLLGMGIALVGLVLVNMK